MLEVSTVKSSSNGTRAGPPAGTKNCDCISFNAIAGEDPVAHVIQGALNVPAEQPRVGDRNALSSKLSDPFWI